MILPGFFRATKNRDVLVIHERRLPAVFEFKSKVGSFGNNFNNRSEEVIGSAADLWVAHHHGAYGDGPKRQNYGIGEHAPSVLNPALQPDPRPPFLAWLVRLEDCPGSLAILDLLYIHSSPMTRLLEKRKGRSRLRAGDSGPRGLVSINDRQHKSRRIYQDRECLH